MWPGGLAHNVFNHSELEPFIGMVNITDYIQDLQYPHMLSLALDYGSEIMVRQYEVGVFS
jgi:alpha-L-fucosidase